MVDTSERAEIKNCIRNARDCMIEMGSVLDQLPVQDQAEKVRLKELCDKTGTLLKEAQQRCERIL